MRIVIPMAGKGSRLRPHTLTTPKPLIPIAGKPIVQRLVEDIAKVAGHKIEEVAFITGDFGVETENNLIKIAEKTIHMKKKITKKKLPILIINNIISKKMEMQHNLKL